ncbi:G-protein coupled receptor-associated protein LMBRD2 [Tachypleus tridentatus]|uniref:G-protein coupled receptor-associated protein LMBRD2 n=1 Tax=Tachypleus tridentatus TaxID=6853 RepID=UPI003FD0F573
MTVAPLVVEISFIFLLAAYLLHKYGNWTSHHVLVTVAVFVAWYFSFTVIFILPLDVSTTSYRQCLRDQVSTITNSSAAIPLVTSATETGNTTILPLLNVNVTQTALRRVYEVAPGNNEKMCHIPWSHIPAGVLPSLWRVVYWTSQALTWLILPMMQSFSTAGDFTVGGKLRTAVVENAIYYGTYLLIFGILLIYVAAQPGMYLDGSKLKVICITASNTWGLFLLVLLLGYGLVEVPRICWNKSKRGHMLNYLYFKAAKLSTEKCEAEEKVDDLLEKMQQVSNTVPIGHPLRRCVEIILEKCPEEKKNSIRRRRQPLEESPGADVSERNIVRIHQQIIRALQAYYRTQCQWNMLIEETFDWEDVARNEINPERTFKPTFMPQRSSLLRALYTPTVEWYWKCLVRSWVFRTLAIVLATFSAIVVWSEMTFFTRSPTLSLFAVFVDLARRNYDYIAIEMVSTLTIAYLCICAYYTVFKVRVLNYYYLAPHHQTDEYSLIFCGMLLCRLTPPLCLNFLGLIHLDSHVIKEKEIMETAFTEIMGHMDVISIISDGFNIYFPILIFLLCLATYFRCGSRVLHMLGFEQFLGEDEMTVDLIEEGKGIIKREKSRKKRYEEGEARRRQYQMRFGNQSGTCGNHTDVDRDNGRRGMMRSGSDESARAELLRDVEPVDYTEERGGRVVDNFTESYSSFGLDPLKIDMSESRGYGFGKDFDKQMYSRVGHPPGGIFDDV